MALYETLAHHFIDCIKYQKLPVGSRLPALRSVVKQHKVSMTTAIKAYDYLQQTGWIYVQPQSGYFVANQVNCTNFPSSNFTINEPRDPKRFAPLDGYNAPSTFFSPLGTAMLAPDLQPLTDIQRCIKRVTNRATKSLFQYPDIQGNKNLRLALSEHFRHEQFAFSMQDIVITHGCIDSIKNAIETLTQVGDTIAISSPCFSGLLDLLTAMTRKVIEIPINDNELNLQQLEKIMQKGLIQASLFSTSNINPLGNTLSIEQKKKLAKIVNKYKIPMIEDDVYFELSYPQENTLPVKYWDEEGYVVWCGSLSKTLAAGLRIGWCLPGRYIKPYMNKYAMSNLGVNALMQSSVAEFINTGDYRSHIKKVCLQLHKQVHSYRLFLVEHLPKNAIISVPNGGMVLWLQIPNLNAFQLEKDAKSRNIDIRSGACFSTHDFYYDCFRINCGWPLTSDIYDQLKTLCELIHKSYNEQSQLKTYPQNPY